MNIAFNSLRLKYGLPSRDLALNAVDVIMLIFSTNEEIITFTGDGVFGTRHNREVELSDGEEDDILILLTGDVSTPTVASVDNAPDDEQVR
ncbi:hypothetical protein MP228_013051 [Amoeboaphelidium protococcarum]|nr:hypothetical protein MP228_013051 [Amoeboaphelidium protococcarum]